MFNISTIKTSMIGMIGLRDSDDPEVPICTLTGTTQSAYFNGYHPLVTFDNLYKIAPNFNGMNFAKWSSTGYATGSYAMFDNVAYYATRTMLTGDTPSLTGTAWISPVNNWVTDKKNEAITTITHQIFTDKKVNEGAKTFLDSVQVVDGAGKITDTITASGRFVGFEIKLKRTNNIKAVINYIGLQFSEIQSNRIIYLFHSSQKTAVGTWIVTTSAAESFDWVSGTVSTGTNEMHYVNYANNIDSGGTYYLGYFEDDITGSAIEKDLGCDPCGFPNSNYKWSDWAEIRPMEIASGDLDGTNIFDIDAVSYGETNYGLNLSFSIKTDITEMLVNNKALFVTALGYQFANDMIREMIYNPGTRLNRVQGEATRNTILYEWNAPDNPSSIVNKLKAATDAIGYDLSKISQVVPKSYGRTIRYGAI